MRSIVFVFLVLWGVAGAGAFDLDSLLVESVGGERALESISDIRTVSATGSVVLNGEVGRFNQYFAAPDSYYLEVVFDRFSLVQAYDGTTAWQIDLNGRVSELDGFAKQELLQNIYFESFAYLSEDSTSDRKAYLGLVERDGQSYHQVAFYPFENDTLWAYYNPETSLREVTFSRIDQFSTLTYVDDYRLVSDILIPHYSYVLIAEASFVTEIQAEAITLNGPLPPKIFAIPAQDEPDYHFPDTLASVVIPFQYVDGHIRLPVTVNGRQKFWVILDSGASANIFHSGAIDSLNLPVVGSLPAIGVAGYEGVNLVQTDSVAVGGLTLYGQVAGSMDMSVVASRMGFDSAFGGILGYDFLSRFPILIDYDAQSLTVFNPGSFEAPPGGIEVDFYLTLLIPTIAGQLNGFEGDFIVDLGNAYGLILHHGFTRQHQIADRLYDVREIRGGFGGVGGSLGGKTGLAATFEIGSIVTDSLRVFMPDSSSGISGSEQLAGNIGNSYLENYRVLLDYNGNRLILYERGNPSER